MCLYCNMGDSLFRWDPPWRRPWHAGRPHWPYPFPMPPGPASPGPTAPWPLEKLREYAELVRRARELEDRAGCPRDPDKPDYQRLFADRIAYLETPAGASATYAPWPHP